MKSRAEQHERHAWDAYQAHLWGCAMCRPVVLTPDAPEGKRYRGGTRCVDATLLRAAWRAAAMGRWTTAQEDFRNKPPHVRGILVADNCGVPGTPEAANE